IASYNVLNLDPNDLDGDTDVADGRFTSIALQIVNALGSPDIVALQEIQDNSGSANDGTVSASVTLQMLVDSIAANGGPVYSFIDNSFITNNTNGGEPGGNIRVAYLYDASRVSLVPGSVATTTNAATDFAGSRQPLVATFEFNDTNVTVINNHFSSKGGSSPLFGSVQPSINGSAAERLVQAQNVANYVTSLGTSAKVVVLGDLNEFANEESLAPLGTAGLSALSLTLPETERYSFIFEGNAQELDQVYISGNLTAASTLDIVHVNAEFVGTAARASDHDPSVLAINITAPAPAPLAPGDIAFVGYNADGTDNLAFVALKALASGTTIYFSDNEWNGTGWTDLGESLYSLTLTSNVSAGSIVRIDTINNVAPTSNAGTIAYVPAGGSNRGMSNDGDTIYAYLADAATPLVPTTFLAAVTGIGFTVAGGVLTGTGLVAGQTAADLSTLVAGVDIAAFNGARDSQSSFGAYAAVINTAANWIFQNASGDQSADGTAPDAPFATTAFTLSSGGENQSIAISPGTLAQNEGNADTTAFVFTVTRSGGTTGQLDFTGTAALNGADNADFVGGTAPASFSGSILAGATTAIVTINVAGDTLVEANEGFSLTLATASNAAAGVTSATVNSGAATATATITNDDFAVPTLVAGDIAFTGFNADGSDNIAFVALKAINAGETIFFTDNEWQGAGFNTGETVFQWTASANVAAGTVVTIDNIGSGTLASNLGTVTFNDASGRGLAAGSDIVYAYVAATPGSTPTFLAAVTNDSLEIAGTVGDNNFATATGTGLAIGATAIALASSTDIGAYTASRANQSSFPAYAAAVNTVGNWTVQQGSGDQHNDGTIPDVPFSTTAFTLAPAGQTIGFAANSLTFSRPEGDSAPRSFTFTVSRAGGTSGQVEFTGTIGAGTTNAADFGGTLPTSFSGSILAGATTGTVTVTFTGDTTIEADEVFSLTLTGGTNSLLAAVTVTPAIATATATIVNDDATLNIGGINVYDSAASLAGSTATPVASDDVVLVRLGSIQGSVAGAESIAYENGKVYSTNIAGNAINVHSVTAAGTLVNETPISLLGLPSYLTGGVNSVDVKNGVIAAGYENANTALPGFVALFNAADNSLIKTIQVGILPDDVTFSPDGLKLLVANEGEALSAQGTISIIDLSGGAANAAVTNTISFASLNGAEAALRNRGVAIAPGQPAAGDIEPEYITISADGTRAYVTLQEVNSVAVIDLTNPAADRPLSIQPLGTVDRNLPGNALDTSDQDGGINLRNVNIQSLIQPDAVASYTVGGVTYFITANEGDARVNVTDSVRLSSSGYVLDPTLFPNAAALKANADLGRLNVLTTVGDTDGDGDFDVIHTLGGRGISIFRQEADGSITKVRETGGEFEAIIAANNPAIFNSNQSTAANSRDTRSDDKGPEPEGVSIGTVNGRTYAFVGLERVGGYMVYDVTDPANAVFVTYKPQTGADLGPETSAFVSAADSPTGQALLLSAQEISNTVTLYSIQTQSAGDDVINGGAEGERWFGRGGNDIINGNGGNDILDGGAGNDVLNGGEGIDTASYGSATSGVNVNLGIAARHDTLGAGVDSFSSIENLFGSAFDDVLLGDGLNNRVDGGAGNDVLLGARGNDTLFGGAGNDLLQGGVGADVFAFDSVSNGSFDIVTDFAVSQGDSLTFGAGVTVTGVSVAFVSTGDSLNGFATENGARSLDLVLTLSSSAGTQTVFLLDAYGLATNAYWENALGIDLTYPRPLPTGTELVPIA
ncbi:MAG: choice-of-anchor I family protein, partial [Polymorphobacter sp.]